MESKIEKLERVKPMALMGMMGEVAPQWVAKELNRIIDRLNSQAQPEEKEGWEKRFIRTFGYWGEEIKFIKQLLDEREREVLDTVKEIISGKSIYQENGNECGTPLELIEWFVDTELSKLNKEE